MDDVSAKRRRDQRGPQLVALTILPIDTDGYIPPQKQRPADHNKNPQAAGFSNHRPDGRAEAGWIMPDNDSEAVAEFIRTKGITRCPTACVLPTQGLVAAADRVALEEHAVGAGPFTPSTSRCSLATIFKLQGPTPNIAGLAIRAARSFEG
jgi:hypothetical protein